MGDGEKKSFLRISGAVRRMRTGLQLPYPCPRSGREKAASLGKSSGWGG